MKQLLVLLTTSLCMGAAFAKPDEPPGARGNPPPKVTWALPKPPGGDKPLASVQGGIQFQNKSGRTATTEVLKFNPPKQ